MEALARSLGYKKVSHLKLAVVKKIRDYVQGGGFMFAMCSATDTYDIALAADGLDICAKMYDGDAQDPSAGSKLNFENTFAFKDFRLVTNPLEYEYSNIDNTRTPRTEKLDYFTLFDFFSKMGSYSNDAYTKSYKDRKRIHGADNCIQDEIYKIKRVGFGRE